MDSELDPPLITHRITIQWPAVRTVFGSVT
jgi:hypothetical protein